MLLPISILLLGLAVIARLWYTGHPEIIDRGDDPKNKRAFWNDHSKLHLFGSAIIAFVIALLDAAVTDRDGFLAGLIVTFLLGLAVELAQKFPKDEQGGYLEPYDLWWDFIGAFVGAWLGGVSAGLVGLS
jgi:hypothetical protein